MNAPALAFSPLYKQVKSLLLGRLEGGVYPPDSSLPSETDLALELKVSQGTVRRAIDELAQENLVIRRQGKGTFVASHKEARVQYRFLRLRPNIGERQPAKTKLLSVKRKTATAAQAIKLALEPKAEIIHIQRLIEFDGKAVVFDDIVLPAALFPQLTSSFLQQSNAPLYSLLEAQFGVKMIKAQEQVKAVLASKEIAKSLNCLEGEPLLQATRISYTYGEKPAELRRGWYLTQEYHYWSELA